MPLSDRLTKNLISGRPGAIRVVAVAAGGLIGSAARLGVVGLWLPSGAGEFPTGVLVVNLVGSLLLGFLLARRERAVGPRASVQFWAIGMLGAFTTFSTFSVDLVELLGADRLSMAVSYGGSSLGGGLIMAVAGRRIGTGVR